MVRDPKKKIYIVVIDQKGCFLKVFFFQFNAISATRISSLFHGCATFGWGNVFFLLLGYLQKLLKSNLKSKVCSYFIDFITHNLLAYSMTNSRYKNRKSLQADPDIINSYISDLSILCIISFYFKVRRLISIRQIKVETPIINHKLINKTGTEE